MRALSLFITSALALPLASQTPLVPPAPPPGTLPPLLCTANVNGAAGVIDGSAYPCTSRVTYDSVKQILQFTLTLSPTGSGSVVRITASFSAPQAAPRADTFLLGNGKITGDITLKETAGRTAPVWSAGKSDTGTLVGQSSIELDDLGTPPTTPGQPTVYVNPPGSITATLEPQKDTTANGEVTLQLAFAPQP